MGQERGDAIAELGDQRALAQGGRELGKAGVDGVWPEKMLVGRLCPMGREGSVRRYGLTYGFDFFSRPMVVEGPWPG